MMLVVTVYPVHHRIFDVCPNDSKYLDNACFSQPKNVQMELCLCIHGFGQNPHSTE